MSYSYKILAPAKLNLYLGVYSELDSRNYHRVDSIMAACNLCDEITIEPADCLSVECTPQVDFPEEENSCYKAAIRMGQIFERDPNFHIHIQKNIPFKSGLGGASSDAAATIKALCRAWDIDVSDSRVFDLAKSLGADVPFFLNGAPQLLEGAGDIPAQTFTPLSDIYPVLVRPWGDGITAAQAYAEFDSDPVEAQDRNPIVEALVEGRTHDIPLLISNNLHDVALRLMPQLVEPLSWLDTQVKNHITMITGSGSCMFTIAQTIEEANEICSIALDRGWWAKAVEFMPKCPQVEQFEL